MTIDPRHALNAALRKDLGSFIAKAFRTVSPSDRFLPNWHIDTIAHHLEECYHGRIKRLIITVPPRSLKSICASVAFPAWVLGRDPTVRMLCASYSNDLSAKLARDTRAVMESAWYEALFPRTRLKGTSQTDLRTTAKGMRYATSVEGTLTGLGGDILIIDDPLKPQDAMSQTLRQGVNEWYGGTLYSRLNNKAEDVIILIMQRLHVDDLVAHVLEKENWVHLDIPAIAREEQRFALGQGRVHRRMPGEVLDPRREPQAVLDAIKANLGTFNFNAQYQQCPSPIEGNLVRWEWFKSFEPPLPNHGGYYVQSWDTASKAGQLNDYSVCTTWFVKDDQYHLEHVFRERLEYPALKKKVVELARRRHTLTLLIEDKGSGIQLIQDLRRETKLYIEPIQPESDKITRMSNQSAQIEAGKVWLPEHADWLADFKAEILAFPHSRHDDQVDSVSQFLGWCDRPRRTAWRGKLGGL